MTFMTNPVDPITSLQLGPSPDPSEASDDDDDDAFNTAEARLHFGPIRSPEKRFGAIVAQPPSALAIKISRAHDNPSPPPTPPTELGPVDLATPSPRFPIPSLTAALLDSANATDTEGSAPPTSADVTPGLSRNISPAPLKPADDVTRRTNNLDLISFESFASPAAVFRAISPSVPQGQSLSSSDIPSVDQLFSQSPNLPRSPPSDILQEASARVSTVLVCNSDGEDEHGPAKVDSSAIQERNEEQSVLDSLLLPVAQGFHEDVPDVASSDVDEAARTPTQSSIHPDRNVTRCEDDEEVISLGQVPGNSSRERPPEVIAEETIRAMVEDQDMNSPPKSVFLRELGSLSPTSTDLLSSLVAPPSRRTQPFSLTIPTNAEATSSARRPFPSSSSLPLPQTPRRSTSPIRFASPSRLAPRNPSTIRLQPMSLDDPTCTPARRITIGEAIAQGHVSPQKGSQLLASSSRPGLDGVYKPLLSIPPTDSPARRVLTLPEAVTPVAQKKWQGIRFGSPTRTTSKERFSSAEPPTADTSKGKSRERDVSAPPAAGTSTSFSLHPSTTSSAAQDKAKSKLPFPLVPSARDIPTTILEEHQVEADAAMASPSKPSQAAFSSPVKSSLKHTTSRIPRTVKPYAKPPLKQNVDKGKSTMRSNIRAIETDKSELNSDEPLPVSRGGAINPSEPKAKTATTARKVEAPVSNLKRKRTVAEQSSPVKPRPPVILRQVPRVVIPSAPSTSKASVLPSIATQKKLPQQIRRVIDKPGDVEAGPSTRPNLQVPSGRAQREALLVPEIEVLNVDGTDSDDKEMSTPEKPSNKKILSPSPDPIAEMAAPPDVVPDGVRRTTRIRKVLNPSLMSDAFGIPDTKGRRKPSAQTNARSDGSYSGMSATALRALTTSNTVRNQRYLAAKLETEVIRKEGDRPESPAVKIKTVSQREQDEKGRQRKDRAARRARLSGEGVESLGDEDGRSDGDTGDDSDWDDMSRSPTPKRHKRGPGEEEDYKTPLRKLRKLKLGDDDTEESTEFERRVKWDRGLFTTIYLDQVKLGTRRPPKENIATKGCLAPTAKTLTLDNLGNLPYADSPLTDLVEENVVVKKFVYDNDAEAVEEVVVKNTRARSKKGKS
ncbi:hypothetical protein DXG01_014586 [Tephrocybe rancida]|nr:hypothetical protein DXG01_014586 [Tephrocybe rancida]